VSPTSWTADEDFDLLLDAAARWDARSRAAGASLPPLAVVVTGDGPRRAEYERRFAALRLERVHLRTLWLPPADYPRFVGAADVGLSLHRSASGLDLPMKVADLLGAGLPVVAYDYGPCLAELVRDGEDALLFRTGAELAACLARLLDGFPAATPLRDRLRAAAARAGRERWPAAWAAAARPLLLGDGGR
jgi:beta-1,4-mannosyltransferase